MLTHGDADDVVPISGTRHFHDQLCAAGETTTLLTDPTWGHVASWVGPLEQIVSWITDRFDGAPAPTDCP